MYNEVIPYYDKLMKDLNNMNENYTNKSPKSFTFWFKNNIFMSTILLQKVSQQTPELREGWVLLRSLRINAYTFTKKWYSANDVNLRCIGCHSLNINDGAEEDAYHLLAQCTAWKRERSNAYEAARSITYEPPLIKMRVDKLLAINDLNPDISIFKQPMTESVKQQQWFNDRLIQDLISIKSDADPQQMMIQYPMIWSWMAYILYFIDSRRTKLLSDTGPRFKPKEDEDEIEQ